ncbi:MAG: pro-sigmaK processing inhibitor BofA family protein [Firmicutes bacterium]|nr:pro-sigmaK processing inhibitor BofA family protein [Alicyclobacillaceae bacterium]MCL6496031.1 pro-sigmaK processing inhibitor BofA family protein [Bacillota bacterium]
MPWGEGLALAAGAAVLLALGPSAPRFVRFLGRWLGSSALAAVGLLLWDHLLARQGLAVGVNPVTAATVGLLGLPGFGLLLVLKLGL